MVRIGLREKIIAISSGVMLIAVVAIIASSSYFFQQTYTQAIQSRAAAIATSLKGQLESILYLGIQVEGLIGFEEQCQNVIKNYEMIDYAMVIGPDGRILFHSDVSMMRQSVTDPVLLQALQRKTEEAVALKLGARSGYGAIVPARGPGGIYVASIVIGIPAEAITRQVQRMTNIALGMGLFFVVAGILALIGTLSIFVIRPLSELIETVEKIEQPGTSTVPEIHIRSKDEIGQLATAFNAMASRLHDIVGREKDLAAVHARAAEQARRSAELEQAVRSLEDMQDASLNVLDDLNRHRQTLETEIEARKQVEAALRESEERYRGLARYDTLTDLPNRRVFVEAVEQAIARARRRASGFAVLYLDLDHFKDINDTLGHPIGDLLLKRVAERLKDSVRKTDIVARFGGDEFAILATDIGEPTDAGFFASKLLGIFSDAFLLEGNEIHSSTSIGIALYEQDIPDAETLLAHADLALYRAKSEGCGSYHFFTGAMDEEVRSRVTLITELRQALVSNQLLLMYQPQVDIGTGRIVGVEALVRWRHPQRGLIPPVNFIAVAEQSGLITALGRWVMQEACRQTRRWLDAGIAPAVTAINLSAVQFKTPAQLESDIGSVLRETSIPPHYLELELTESALMETSRAHNDVLQRLRNLGIKLAIDDFGMGYSSLDYLRRFPANRIKIAQEFVADIVVDPSDAAIVKAAIRLCHDLDLNVIAEGVETAEQLALLYAWGCREVQGYYFSKPLLAGDIEPLLRHGQIQPLNLHKRSMSIFEKRRQTKH